ncbi:MAG: phenylalanine--tRNA ligase subunit beta [Deltaproteobacteria bacterium]|nr:phenylalanine--tRNA ligase subunit beta [Deltaproteobacteria bacterium]
MRVSLNWLKEFVEIDQTPAELAEMLTMAGLEVEGLEHKAHNLNDCKVCRILDIKPHPRADRLSICQVDAGKETVSVVCGATNMRKGDFVPLAPPGTTLPDGILIKESTIRGELSHGMLLAEDEMDLTDDHTGIMILPDKLTPGQPLTEAMDLEDWILEITLTPNRIDCASVLGIAREIGALTRKKVTIPEVSFEEGDRAIEDLAEVNVLDSNGCPRYTAGLIDTVTIGPSPFWMRYRLYTSGVRSINNVVDITNYVLMEFGQPLHAFDYHRLGESKIVVKRAEQGQTFITLDEQTRELDDQTLMICDGKREVAIAGIMGGLNSEITEDSTAVLIESAYFNPTMIRRSSKKLSLSTEASYRFERGIDIEGTDLALRRSLQLMQQLAGGTIAKGVIDCYPNPWSAPHISLRSDRANTILGTHVAMPDMIEYLSALQMDVKKIDHNNIEVSPPSFRVDITREADLVEEIARLTGYDNIPVTLPPIRPAEEDSTELSLRARLKNMLVGMGFTEIITYSFISPKSADILKAGQNSNLRSFVKLLNPLTQDQSVMRTSLIPGLLSTVRLNSLRGQNDLRIFEWGKIYIKGEEELPQEKQVLAVLITGMGSSQEWYQKRREADFFDIKGVAENILEELGIEKTEFKRNNPKEGFDPDEYARIFSSGFGIGVIGKVAKEVIEGYGLEKSAYIVEIYIETLFPLISRVKKFTPLAKFPSVRRDISIILNRSIESAMLINIVKEIGKDLVESVKIFDIYQGKQIIPQEKALALGINYRSKERTLTDEEVNEIHEEVIREIRRQTGGRLREGPKNGNP